MDTGLRTDRNTEESLSDALVTLALFTRVQQVSGGCVGDRLKAMKLVFLLAHHLFMRRARAVHLSFFRYEYGPFTPQVYDAWEGLSSAGFLSVDPDPRGPLTVTPKGLDFGDRFAREVLEAAPNRAVGEAIRTVVDANVPLTTSDLLDAVYAKRVTPIGWNDELPLRDVPRNAFLTKVIESWEAASILTVHPRWYRSIRLEQMESVAAIVGEDRPLLDGLTLEQARELARLLDEQEQGGLETVDLEAVRAAHGLQ